MHDRPVEARRGEFRISTDRGQLPLDEREAQALYAPFGFGPAPEWAVYMELRAPNTPDRPDAGARPATRRPGRGPARSIRARRDGLRKDRRHVTLRSSTHDEPQSPCATPTSRW